MTGRLFGYKNGGCLTSWRGELEELGLSARVRRVKRLRLLQKSKKNKDQDVNQIPSTLSCSERVV